MAAVPAWLLFQEGPEAAILLQMPLEANRDAKGDIGPPGKARWAEGGGSPYFFRLVSLFLATEGPLEAFLGTVFSGSFFPPKPWAL